MLKQVDLVVAQINVGKQELFAPMVAYGISPDMFLGSDTDGLNMEFRAAAADQLAAPNKPVALPGAVSQIALHDSAANNFGAMFAGLTVDEQRFREAVFDSIGYTPVDAVEPPGGEIAHEITFSKVRPIEARFVEDRVKVHAEIDGLTHSTEKFTFDQPVTVHVVYRFETTATGIQFVREAFDCNVDAARQEKCLATLDRFFVQRAEQDDITTLGQMLALLQLKPIQPTCDRGWLQMPLVDR